MTSRRVLKAAEAIREVVSMAILVDLRDPRIQDVTVIRVEVTGDMRAAKVHVSVMGDDKKQQLALHGLQSAAGYLQSKVAARIDTRYTPRLSFALDQGVKKQLEVNRILRAVLPAETAPSLPVQTGMGEADDRVDNAPDDLADGQISPGEESAQPVHYTSHNIDHDHNHDEEPPT